MSDIDLGACQVCNAAPAIGVCCSALGPLSLAYCAECNAYGCEPYGLTVGIMATFAGGFDDVSEGFHWTIYASCLRAKKTAAEFWADVEREREEMANDPRITAPKS